MKNEDDQFKEKIRRLIPQEEDRLLMLITLMGMSAVLCEFIIEKNNIKSLPITVKYACANIAGNMLSFISDGEKGEVIDISHLDYEMHEQTQEVIYRKMKYIIELLYKSIHEKEKI